MVSLISTLQCVLRLAFALVLGHTAMQEIFTADPVLIGAIAIRTPGLATSILCIALAVLSIWLILGVGTRAVALTGFGIYAAHELLLQDFDLLGLELSQSCVLVALLALPLVFFGGGRFSVVSTYSREPI
ncbi:hypothetical protein PVT71_00555 [Salipiger sp. H15]|uniref:DoxX family protein n=1 Tax=Alloyangia sp. H15 TaxID=3029062 RepID=A0AAU8AFS2_9RHOB